jgi:poly(A) polymerase
LYRLLKAGFAAYLVGGGVRDLLLGREPKDFDLATDASPDEVRRLFRNCRLIGRRFRLAHVHFGPEIIEVATFRANGIGADEHAYQREDGRILRDNVYGTLEEDAWRRDFTINALYYNIEDFSVVDYTGGTADLDAGLVRLIGDPEQRYREDPVRMLRAVRFAAKLGFKIDEASAAPLRSLAPLLEDVPAARLYEEVVKLFCTGAGLQGYELLRQFGLFGHLFPDTEACLVEEHENYPRTFLAKVLASTDLRVGEGKPVNPAFMFAALLWEPVAQRAAAFRVKDQELGESPALEMAGAEILGRQLRRVNMPRRISHATREIWSLQLRLMRYRGKRAQRLVLHPRFRAAYDFLLMRAEADERLRGLAERWTRVQAGQVEEAGEEKSPAGKPRSRRRRKKVAPG